MKYVIAMVSCLLIVSGAIAQQVPKGPAPVLKVVASVDDEKGWIDFNDVVVFRLQTGKMIVENDAKPRKEVIEVQVGLIIRVEIAKCRIITPDGKPVQGDDVWKRVKANTVVAFVGNDQTPDAASLKALDPRTVVILAPSYLTLKDPNFRPRPKKK